jgi:hypothetical protein
MVSLCVESNVAQTHPCWHKFTSFEGTLKRFGGFFLRLANKLATFTCKVMGISFSAYEFSP